MKEHGNNDAAALRARRCVLSSFAQPSVPTRVDVDGYWAALISGRMSREEVYELVNKWVDEADSEVKDPMVRNGLQALHGFSLRQDLEMPGIVGRGLRGAYLHSGQEIIETYARWRGNCARYDADPVEYVRMARERARAVFDVEK